MGTRFERHRPGFALPAHRPDFVAIEGTLVLSTAPPFVRRRIEGSWSEWRERGRLHPPCSLRSGDPGARSTSRKARAHRFANRTARTLTRRLRPAMVISVHASRREVIQAARNVEDRTLARANPHVARKNQQKSASEAEVQEARSAGNGRVHGDLGPGEVRKVPPRGEKASRSSRRGGYAMAWVEGPSRTSERASRGEGSCWMEGVSARPPGAIVHAITTATS